MDRLTRLAIVVIVALALAAQTGAAQSGSPGAGWQPGTVSIVFQPFADGLDAPVFLTPDGTGDGVLYAVEQGGTIREIAPDGTVATAPFLDLGDKVQSGGEQGLLGLAFHPDYATNGRLFVYYTRAGGGSQVVSEFHAVDGVVDPTSERLILEMPDFAENHNGGMLAFDPEGMLLIGTGDGGGAGDPHHNGQDVTQLLAKLLRIDVDGAQPYTTPVNDPNGLLGPNARPEILATGLRNPWRFSLDRQTGDVFIGDVGQDAWEEIDVLPAGQGAANFGWSITEGPTCYAADTCDRTGLTEPVASYSHQVGGCAVVGGYVYRGQAYPALTGAYIFSDDCSGNVWLLSAKDAVTTGSATPERVGRLGSPSAFGQGDDGELYMVDLGGSIVRVTAAAP